MWFLHKAELLRKNCQERRAVVQGSSNNLGSKMKQETYKLSVGQIFPYMTTEFHYHKGFLKSLDYLRTQSKNN